MSELQCEEMLQRRFWISIRREKCTTMDEKLLALGFHPNRKTGTVVMKTTDFNEMRGVVAIVEKLIKNSARFIQLKTTTQPMCLSCGKYLRFADRVCPTCGSTRIKASGWFDPKINRVFFKEEKE